MSIPGIHTVLIYNSFTQVDSSLWALTPYGGYRASSR